MENYFADYSRYNAKNERYSIFGREKNGKLEIWMWRCNKKDQFSKAIARFWYDVFLGRIKGITNTNAKAEILLVPIEEGNSAKFQFGKFCRENFYRKITKIVRVEQEYLSSTNDIKSIGKPKKWGKW